MATMQDATSPATIGDQRPPRPVPGGPRAGAPRHAMRRTRVEKSNGTLVEALGWFSIALGVAQIVAPRALSRAIGVEPRPVAMRAVGLREIACGIGLLSGREPEGFLWARVAGDAMDLAMVGRALASGDAPLRSTAAFATVAGVTAVDVYAASSVRRSGVSDTEPRDRTVVVEKNLAVNRSPEECYARWRDFAQLPRFMKFVESVTVTSPTRSHWVARSPGGATIEWDSEITNDQPGKLIAWRADDGADVQHEGVVRFEPGRDGRGAWVRVEIRYLPPGGALGAMLARIMNVAPAEMIEEDIRRFKRLVETGEVPTIDGQSHGQRSLVYGLVSKEKR